MQGRVQFAMTGTHWWTMPENWPITEPLLRAIGQYNRYMSEQAPVEFARRLGAPVLQASHCGPLSGTYLVLPGPDIGFERAEGRGVGKEGVRTCGSRRLP